MFNLKDEQSMKYSEIIRPDVFSVWYVVCCEERVGHTATELMSRRIWVCVHCSLEWCSVHTCNTYAVRYQNSARLYLSLNRGRINRSSKHTVLGRCLIVRGHNRKLWYDCLRRSFIIFFFSSPDAVSVMKEDRVDRACSTHRRDWKWL